ncbi:MAG: hypothetical protein JST19_06080 [Bacteroidetes bacterium]|nr:hypothetical protein [Bacteroidota bacterium]
MKRKYKLFDSVVKLNQLVDQYFEYIKGEYQPAVKQPKLGKTKSEAGSERICIREPEAPTLAGMILYLGFNSREEFESCAAAGRYRGPLNRAKLRIEAIFEQSLHGHSGGAIYALKSMGYMESMDKTEKEAADRPVLKVEVMQSGPGTAANEKEVVL